MRVLVLGGSYFVGAAIAKLFQSNGHSVTVANRGTRPVPHPEIGHFPYDRSDTQCATRLPSADVVVDTSCYTVSDARNGLASLAEVPERYVFVSSAAVYAPPVIGVPLDENSPATGDPIWGDYGVEKLAAERVLQEALGPRLVILRPPYLYGPHNNVERESFIWDRLLVGRPILIPGDGSRLIQFAHVDDLSLIVSAFATDSTLFTGSYNVGEARAYSIREYLDVVGRACERMVRTVSIGTDIPARSYFPFRNSQMFLNCDKIQSALAPRFQDLATGLSSTFQWYRRENRRSLVLTDLEISHDEQAI